MPYGRDNTGNKNVLAQRAALANKLNFGTPSKTAPQTPPRVDDGGGKPKGVSKDPNFAANRAAIAGKFGGQQKPASNTRGASKDPNFAANRAAIAGKFGGQQKPASNTRGAPKPSGASKDPNFAANRAAIAGKIFGGQQKPANNGRGAPRPTNTIPKPSGGKEFQNQKAALASKLNFRPPLPPGDPRGKPPNAPPAAAVRPIPKPKPPPLGRNDNNGSEFTNQKAALANKLVFRPPLPASPKSGGPGPKPSPPRPATEMPPLSPKTPEPRYSSKPPTADDNMGLQASQAAAIASRMRSYNPEDVTTTSVSSNATSLQDARSVRSVSSSNATSLQDARSVRSASSGNATSLQDARSVQSASSSYASSGYSIRKDNPPPAEPEMKYVRSYRIGGGAEEPTKEEPQVTQVLLIDEKYEWGTRPLNKRYHQNRVVVKRFTTYDEEEMKRQRKKKGGGCTVM